jgi:LysM repeat protein
MKRLLNVIGSARWRMLVVPLLLMLLLLVLVPGARAETEQASCGYYYTVRWGDNLYRIARYHGTTVQAIAHANHIVNPNRIYAGQSLYIPCGGPPPGHPPPGHPPPGHPPPGASCRYHHTVTWGDTLIRLGYRYGVSPWAIAHANGIHNMNLIYRGQVLCIP